MQHLDTQSPHATDLYSWANAPAWVREIADGFEATIDSGLLVTPIAGAHPTVSIENIRMASAYDPWREAHLALPRLINSSVVHMYGLGLGHLPHTLLNSSKHIQHLHVYVLNLKVFKIQLQYMPFKGWFSDPRVSIHIAQPTDRPNNAGTLHAVLPDLQLISPELWRLRDRLHALLNQNFINSAFRHDDPALQNMLKANEGLLHKDPGVKTLFGSRPSRHACVIGSGPSLELSIDRLHDLGRGNSTPWVIAVDTAYAPLMQAGIKVDCVVSIEKKISTRWLPTEQSENVQLVYTPVVPNEVLLAWKGPRYASYTQTDLHRSSTCFDAASCLFCGGSVIHTATDLALQMGFEEISLWGVDFGYPGGKTHSFWPSGELGGNPRQSGHWVMDVHGQQLASSTNFANYLAEMEDLISRHPKTFFFNASQYGAEILGAQPLPEYSS